MILRHLFKTSLGKENIQATWSRPRWVIFKIVNRNLTTKKLDARWAHDVLLPIIFFVIFSYYVACTLQMRLGAADTCEWRSRRSESARDTHSPAGGQAPIGRAPVMFGGRYNAMDAVIARTLTSNPEALFDS